MAVSGLHIGLVLWTLRVPLLRLCALLGWGPGVAWVASWFLGAVYTFAVGAPPSALRALALAGVWGLGTLTRRPVHPRYALCLAVAVLAWLDPPLLVQPGFQLSAAAVLALVSSPSDAGAWTLAGRVGWTLAPLSWWHFGESCLASMLIDPVALAVFGVALVPAGSIALLGPRALAEGLAWPLAESAATLILDLSRLGAAMPEMSPLVLVGVGGLLLCWQSRRRTPRRGARALVALAPPSFAWTGLIAVALCAPPSPPPGTWWAEGGTRSHSVLVEGRGEAQRSCLLLGGGALASPQSWRLLGSERVGVLRAEPGPRAWALQASMAGPLSSSAPPCLWPNAALVAEKIRECRLRAGTKRAWVRAWPGQEPRCVQTQADLMRRRPEAEDWRPASALPHSGS